MRCWDVGGKIRKCLIMSRWDEGKIQRCLMSRWDVGRENSQVSHSES
jgi:hypothetical protein